MGTKATINEVAEKAGVSIKTVSRVMNKEPNVRPATQEKVLKVAKELNYTPNASARSLAGNRSYLLALLYDNPSPAYVMAVQQGVLDVCQDYNYGLVIHPYSVNDEKLIANVQSMMEQSRVDGILLTPPLTDHAGLLAHLKKNNIPFCRISGQPNESDGAQVNFDEAGAAQAITEHLIQQGHERIGFIQGHPDHSASAQRHNGYQQALKQAGLKSLKSHLAQGYFTFDSGKQAAKKILKQSNPPSAIFCANDYMAAGALHTALEMGLKVPQDLAIAGFDNAPVSEQLWPGLTTYSQPINAMSQAAAEHLLQRLKGKKDLAKADNFQGQLIVRASTGNTH